MQTELSIMDAVMNVLLEQTFSHANTKLGLFTTDCHVVWSQYWLGIEGVVESEWGTHSNAAELIVLLYPPISIMNKSF